MKTNRLLITVEAMLSLILTVGMLPTTFMDGLFCFVLSFCVWFCLLLPAWNISYSPSREEILNSKEYKQAIKELEDL